MIGWILTVFVAVGATVVIRQQWQELCASLRRVREAWAEFRQDSGA